MNLELQIVKGDNAGYRKPIERAERILLGRDVTCDLALNDPLLSRQHCLIEVTETGAKIIDLKSRNGTFLNGKRIEESPLTTQDEIRVGRHILKLNRTQAPVASPQSPAPSIGGRCSLCGLPISPADLANRKALRHGADLYCEECIAKGIEPPDHQPIQPGSASPGNKNRVPTQALQNFGQTASEFHAPPEAPLPRPANIHSAERTVEAPTSPLVNLPPGTPRKIGSYQILSLLGEGGMGYVYKAKHTFLENIVAIKVIKEELAAQPDLLKRFILEAKLGHDLDHPNVLKIHDAGEADGIFFISMEYFDSRDLSGLIKHSGLVPLPQALPIFIQMADALGCAHQHGIIHRDVKPSNVLINSQGLVKVTDFGLAKAWQKAGAHQLTASGQMLGTLQYISPEQLEDARTVDPKADIFSMGATMYFVLTGKAPFGEEPLGKVIENILHNDPPSLTEVVSGVTPIMDKIVFKAMEKKAAKRFKTMEELKEKLLEIQATLDN